MLMYPGLPPNCPRVSTGSCRNSTFLLAQLLALPLSYFLHLQKLDAHFGLLLLSESRGPSRVLSAEERNDTLTVWVFVLLAVEHVGVAGEGVVLVGVVRVCVVQHITSERRTAFCTRFGVVDVIIVFIFRIFIIVEPETARSISWIHVVLIVLERHAPNLIQAIV